MDDLISRQAAIDALKAMAVPRYKDPACEDIWERDRTLDNAIVVMRGLPSAQPKTGECETCRRNADNGGVYQDGRTKCPIQEHYVLLKDGYCHLYAPRMRGEQDE